MPTVYFAPDEMCTMLKLEVKRIHDYFVANGWTIADTPEGVDKVVVPTCSGWDKLEQNALDTLASFSALGDRVVALGCTNTNNPEGVGRVHRGVVVPSINLARAADLIPGAQVELAAIPEPSTFRSREDYRLYDLSKRFVNIAFGCAFTCAYCPHKVGIGPRRSRTVEDIVEQVRGLVAEKVRIVVLTGMETGLYGREIDTDYVTLLRAVLAVAGSFDIHVAQFHPSGLSHYEEGFIALFGNPRITDLQIPIQTVSTRLLKLMARPALPPRLAEVLRAIKARNPKVIMRTDIIVGYPSETMAELEATLALVTEVFDEVAAYGFEMKAGLPAEKLAAQAIPLDEMARRVEYAAKIITGAGLLAHGGQQADLDLVALESLRQDMRHAKGIA